MSTVQFVGGGETTIALHKTQHPSFHEKPSSDSDNTKTVRRPPQTLGRAPHLILTRVCGFGRQAVWARITFFILCLKKELGERFPVTQVLEDRAPH